MAQDTYKYFRIEARELVEAMNQATLELENGGDQREPLARILRFAHTLKGAARVVKQPQIGEAANAIETALAPFREGQTRIPNECTNQLLGFLDLIAAQLAELDANGAVKAKPDGARARPPAPESLETVRVEISEADHLLEALSEAFVHLRVLRREVSALERARVLAKNLADGVALHITVESNGNKWTRDASNVRAQSQDLRDDLERLSRNLTNGIEQTEAEFEQMRDAVNRLRLVPASTIFLNLERAVHDAAQLLGKDLTVSASGGAIRLEAHILTAMRDALLHVVRNAVAHGIEPGEERMARNKARQGRIQLRVERRGARVSFACHDDGRGIDIDEVRRHAVLRGQLPASGSSSFGVKEATDLLMNGGGISTSPKVDEISGRGVGLDVVRETVRLLKGEVRLQSTPGEGTSVEILVPVSLSSIECVEVATGAVVAAIPIYAVRQTRRVAATEILHSPEGDSILWREKAIPFVNLSQILESRLPQKRNGQAISAIVLATSAGAASIGVDRLLGIADVVSRPLPPLAVATPFVAGVSMNAEGDPQLILDPAALIAEASRTHAQSEERAASAKSPVLVIDDSLTTRMLEQSILESAGYEVDTATSAEEGLEKARAKQYGLFLVDVEMPGMDGFEFVARTRADARLGLTPAILVTSRNAAEDRRRGEEAGASAYIVKGEFDQDGLLRMARELIAQA